VPAATMSRPEVTPRTKVSGPVQQGDLAEIVVNGPESFRKSINKVGALGEIAALSGENGCKT